MKANGAKRKIFNDAVDLMNGAGGDCPKTRIARQLLAIRLAYLQKGSLT